MDRLIRIQLWDIFTSLTVTPRRAGRRRAKIAAFNDILLAVPPGTTLRVLGFDVAYPSHTTKLEEPY
jgi:hypothetical protein